MEADKELIDKLRGIARELIVVQLHPLSELGELSHISPSLLGAFLNGARHLTADQALELARSIAAIALVRPLTERGREWLNDIRERFYPQLPYIAPPVRPYEGLCVPAGVGFSLTIDNSLTAEQITEAMNALADFFREVGGAGFQIEFETQQAHSLELVHA